LILQKTSDISATRAFSGNEDIGDDNFLFTLSDPKAEVDISKKNMAMSFV
jgi:hypothetical protein